MFRRIAMSAAFLIFVLCPAVRADVSVSTSLSLSSLTITPITTSGSFGINYLTYGSAYASAEDSFSSNSNYDSFDDPSQTGTVSSDLASASATASTSLFTAHVTGGVSIPGTLNAYANTEAQGYPAAIFSEYEIVDNNPLAPLYESVNVSLSASATLSYNQSLTTDSFGSSASSEVEFELDMPDVETQVSCASPPCAYVPLLAFANPLTIGPSATAAAGFNTPFTLSNTSSSVSLTTDTPYFITIEADAESSGINTPEPGYYLLLAAGLSLLFVSARRFRRV